MPSFDHPRWRLALRITATVAALGSAATATWLVVVGTSTNSVRLGVLLGLWAVILGPVTIFGARRPGETVTAELDSAVTEQLQTHARAAAEAAGIAAAAAVQQAAGELRQASAGRELELRRGVELERERDAAARREFAESLQSMLRQEVERVLRQEVDGMRRELAELRRDVEEKVGGQLQLERIETTRLIGSDLEALQREIRRLTDERTRLPPAPASKPATIVADLSRPTPSGTEPSGGPGDQTGYVGRRRVRDEPDDGPATAAVVGRHGRVHASG